MTGQPGLRRFLQPRAGGAASPPGAPAPPSGGRQHPREAEAQVAEAQERCELCSGVAGPAHGHIADLDRSTLICACRPCYLLFTGTGAAGGRYRAVPGRYLSDKSRPLSAVEWEQLQIPVGLAFFLDSSRLGRVCGFYPSPAGVTECVLDLEAWARLAAGHPLLGAAEPDVEAVLATRTGAGVECFLVPVDACYGLAGRMRLLWQGFDGGSQARRAISEFLDGVRARATDLARGA